MSDEELVEFLSGRDAAVMGLENLTTDMLDRLPELKIISRMGVGLDNVDPAMLRDRGIPSDGPGYQPPVRGRVDGRFLRLRAAPCRPLYTACETANGRVT